MIRIIGKTALRQQRAGNPEAVPVSLLPGKAGNAVDPPLHLRSPAQRSSRPVILISDMSGASLKVAVQRQDQILVDIGCDILAAHQHQIEPFSSSQPQQIIVLNPAHVHRNQFHFHTDFLHGNVIDRLLYLGKILNLCHVLIDRISNPDPADAGSALRLRLCLFRQPLRRKGYRCPEQAPEERQQKKAAENPFSPAHRSFLPSF